MARGGQVLARVAVAVRAGAAPLLWSGLLGAAVGTLPPGLTGRRIGLLAGAALFPAAAALVFLTRRGRYAASAAAAVRAARTDVLQGRAATLRARRRARRPWLLLAFPVAVGTSFAVPAAVGLLVAGLGAGLWLKAVWIGRRETAADRLLWIGADLLAEGGPAGRHVTAYRTTGIAAGDAAPGGARRR
ncbi:hypothetical protein LUX12_03420 [Streptomyces somaliensis]|uniref:hypothetical protein n=1 Tax=Streptomyces somaliensis TaxID=78355 RepID=UPI0020CC41C5|nr:hypothetical protein [Streptomyces somaliensis]MCP9944055.1 hypothetical protein [Streptomyces somaliensis]MCP9975542.1 hypothetical protein [Streptomyces somaliensis]